jgi:hypothetical protein
MGWGKAPQAITVASGDPPVAVDLESMSDHELAQYEARLAAVFPELMKELIGQTGDVAVAVDAN